ncbi:MAG: polyhydroxyalkanoate synthesis repressor PhaR [Rhodanobacter sp.]|jgi:polyhydroxyalkanoate synthesis repressor PhaR|nr:polyhydroxyalkanoate synthesis repressor PhaR [Rhodanobacter sp.]
MAQTKRTIKKYPNRRLYDTEISSYITLEEVRQLVMDNEDFEVRDAKSGDDLTRSVLLQIISEHEDKGQPMLSPQLLSQIIRFYGDSLQGFMGPYLERSLQVFLDQQTQFRSQLNSLMGQTPWTMLNDLTERNMAAFQAMQRGVIETAAKVVPPATGPARGGKKSG